MQSGRDQQILKLEQRGQKGVSKEGIRKVTYQAFAGNTEGARRVTGEIFLVLG